MSNILTGFNMQGNDPIDNRIVSPSKFETLEEYLQRVPIQKRYYGLSFYALDENNELRHYTFQTSLIEPTIDDDEEEIERLDKELQEHVNNKEIHKTSEEIRSEIVDADIPDTIARVQWTLDKIEEAVNTVMGDIVDGASDEYNTLKKIQDKIVELRTEVESQLYGDDGGEVLKTLEQALKFLNQYKDFIVDIPDNYVNKQDIVDNLNTDDPTKVLSARQGKVLSETLTNYFDSAMASIRAETNRATNAENRIEAKLDDEIDRSIKEDQRIDSKLDAEIERSTNEDIRIDTKLDSEINRSTTEDNRLDQKIDAETTRATTAESNLNTKIETETDRAEGEESRIETKLDNEIARSTNKDTEHDNRLTALEGDTHEQNTDLGTTNSTFQLKYNTGNKIKHESDAISVRNAADTDYVNFIAKNATFKGDLLVEGQSFVTEAETVEIKDNLLLLNKGEVGAGVTKGIAGLEIDRGTEPNYQIIFDESDNRFKAGEIGDIQCLALRDGDDSMVNGMFTSWDSSTKRLKTTNIVPSDQKLSFGDNGDIELKYSLSKMGETLSSAIPILNIGRKSSGYPHIEFGVSSKYALIYTDALRIYLQNEVVGKTFKRATDLSEVLYHADIVNNLTSGGTNKVLSAEQGKILQNSITSIQGSYLPLSGGTMTGSIIFPNQKGIFGTLTDGTSNIKIAVVNANNNVEIGNLNTPLMLVSNSTDLTHYRDNNTYKIWDKFNLPDPATSTDLANYLPLAGGTLTGALTISLSSATPIILNNTNASATEISQTFRIGGAAKGYFGYTTSTGVFMQNVTSSIICVKDNGAYYGTSANTLTKLLTSADLSSYATQSWTTSNFYPLAGKGYLSFDSNGRPVMTYNQGYSAKFSDDTTEEILWTAGTGTVVLGIPTNTAVVQIAGTTLSNRASGETYATQEWVNKQGFIKSVTGYLPLTGGTMSGSITIPGNSGTLVITANETSNYVRGISFTKGSTVNSAVFGYHSTGGSNSSGALILVPYPTSANPWDKTVGLYIAKNELLLDGKAIATTDQIPSIPSISISNSGSGNAVTSITASGHTLTVTKGATYLTSSSLDGYATQTWVNNKGYLTSHQTIYNLTFQAGTFAAKTFDPNGAAATVNIPTKTSHITNDSGFITSSALSGYATQSWANGQFPNKTGTGASGTWGINISGNATTATTASKLGSTTIGGSAKPIYLSSGVPTACSATVGSTTVPVYMNAGTITQCSTTLGISITGNAATATTASNSNNLGGVAAATYVKSTSSTKVSDIQVVTTAGSTTGVLYVVLES